MIQVALFFILATGVCMLLSRDLDAQSVLDRLTPPQRVEISPLPRIDVPQPRKSRGADKLPAHLWTLPFGVFPGASTVLSPEQTRGEWPRPAADLPRLASEADPVRPAYPALPFGLKSFVSSQNSQRMAALDRFAMPRELAPRPGDDPTSLSAHAVITGPVPLALPNPAPLLRLAIPDPFEQLRAIRLSQPPVDADAPEAARDRPPPPKLPDVAPVK